MSKTGKSPHEHNAEFTNCAFCGQELDDRPSIASMMHEAHEMMERIASPDPDEFAEALDYVRRFVGAEPR